MMANTRKVELPGEKIQNITDQPQNEPGNNITLIVKLDNSIGSFPPLPVSTERANVLTPLSRSKIPRLKPRQLFLANSDTLVSSADQIKLNHEGRTSRPKWGSFPSVLSKSEDRDQKTFVSTPAKRRIDSSCETLKTHGDSLKTKLGRSTLVVTKPESTSRSISVTKPNPRDMTLSLTLRKSMSHDCSLQNKPGATECKSTPEATPVSYADRVKVKHDVQTCKPRWGRFPSVLTKSKDAEKKMFLSTPFKQKMDSSVETTKTHNESQKSKFGRSTPSLSKPELRTPSVVVTKNPGYMTLSLALHKSMSHAVPLQNKPGATEFKSAGEARYPISGEAEKDNEEKINADKLAMNLACNADIPASYADVLRVNNDSMNMELQSECENVPVVSVEGTRELQNEYENIPSSNKDLDLKYVVHKEDSRDMDSEYSGGEPKSNADLLKLNTTSPKLQPGCKISPGSGESRVLDQKCENHNAESRLMDLKPSPEKSVSCADPLKLNSDGRKCKPKWGHFSSLLRQSEKLSQKMFMVTPSKRKIDSSCETSKSNVVSQKLKPRTRQVNSKLRRYPSMFSTPEHSNNSNAECKSKQIKPFMCVLVKPMSHAGPLELESEATEFKLRGTRLPLPRKSEKGHQKQNDNADKWAMFPTCNGDKLSNDKEVLKLNDSKEMLEKKCENIPADSRESKHRDQNCEAHNSESEDVCSGCNLDKPLSCSGELKFSINFREPQAEYELIHLGSSGVNDIGHTYADAEKWAFDPTYNPDKPASYADVLKVNNDPMEVQTECENVPAVSDESKQEHQKCKIHNAKSMKLNSFCDFDTPLHHVTLLGQKTWELQHECENIPRKNKDLDLKYVVHKEDSRDMDSECSLSEPKSNADLLKLSTTSPKLQPGCKKISPGSGGSRVLDQKCKNHNSESRGMDLKPSPEKSVSCADPLKLNSDGRKCKPKWGHFSSLLRQSEKLSLKMFIVTPSKRKTDSSCETSKSNVSQKLKPRTREVNSKLRRYPSIFSTPEHSKNSIAESKLKQIKPLMCVLVKPMSHAGPLELESETTEFKLRGTRLPLPRKAEKGNKKENDNADKWAMFPTCNADKLANDEEILKLSDSKEKLPECENIPADSGESKNMDQNCDAHNSELENVCSGCNLDKPLSCAGEIKLTNNFRELQPEYELIHLGSSGVSDIGHTYADADICAMDHTYADADKCAMDPTYNPDKPASYADVSRVNNDSMGVQTECGNVPVVSDESKQEHQKCKTHNAKSMKLNSFCDFDIPLHYISRWRRKTWELQHECENIPCKNKDLDLKYVVHKEDSRDMDSECSLSELKSNADLLKLSTTSPKLQPGCKRISPGSCGSRVSDQKFENHNAESRGMDLEPSPEKSVSCPDPLKLNSDGRRCKPKWGHFISVLKKSETPSQKMFMVTPSKRKIDSSCETPKSNVGSQKLNSCTRQLNTKLGHYTSVFSTPEHSNMSIAEAKSNQIKPLMCVLVKPKGHASTLKVDSEAKEFKPRGTRLPLPRKDEKGNKKQNDNADKWAIYPTCNPDKLANVADVLKLSNSKEMVPECENIPADSRESKHGDQNCEAHNSESEDVCSGCNLDKPLSYSGKLEFSNNFKEPQPEHELIHLGSGGVNDTGHTYAGAEKWAMDLTFSPDKPASYMDVSRVNNDSMEMQPECENDPAVSDESKQEHQNYKTHNAKSTKMNSFCDFDIPLHYVCRWRRKTWELQHECENVPRKNKDLDLKYVVHKEDSRDMDSECSGDEPKSNADLLKLSTTSPKLQPGCKRISPGSGGSRVLDQKCKNHNAESRGMDLKPSPEKSVSCADPLNLNSDGRKCKPKWGHFSSVLRKSEKPSLKIFMVTPSKRKIDSPCETSKSNVDSQKLNSCTRQLNTKLGHYTSVFSTPEHSNMSIAEPKSNQIKPSMSVLFEPKGHASPLKLDSEGIEFKPRGTRLPLPRKAENGNNKQKANADKWAMYPTCNPDKLANDAEVLKLNDSKETVPECENIPKDSGESKHGDQNCKAHNSESENASSSCNIDKPPSCSGELGFSNNFRKTQPENELTHLGSSGVNDIGHTYANADKRAFDPTYNPDKPASYAYVLRVNNDSMEVQAECENVPVVSDESKQGHQNDKTHNTKSMTMNSFCDFDIPLHHVSLWRQKTWELQHKCENIPRKNKDLDLKYLVHKEDSRDMDSECSGGEPKSNSDLLKLSSTSPKLQPGCKGISPVSSGSRVLDQKCENHNAESRGMDLKSSPEKSVSCADPLKLNSDGRKCKPKWGYFSSVLSKSEKSSLKMFMVTPNKRKIDSSCETPKSNVDSQKLNPRTRQLNTKLGHYTSVFSTPQRSNMSIAEPKSNQIKPLMCVMVKPMSHAGSFELDSEATELKPRGTRLALPHKAEKGNKKQKANADIWAMYPTCNPDKLANAADVLKLSKSKEMLPECENISADSGKSNHRDQNCEAHNSESEDVCSGLDKPSSYAGEAHPTINYRGPQPEYELIHLGSSGVNGMDHTYADADKWAVDPTYNRDKPASYADVLRVNNDSMEVQPECENVPAVSDESKQGHENCKTHNAKSMKMNSFCDFDIPLHYVSRWRQKTLESQHECENISRKNKDLDLKYLVHKEDSRDMDSECSHGEPKSNADRLNLSTTSPKLQPGCKISPGSGGSHVLDQKCENRNAESRMMDLKPSPDKSVSCADPLKLNSDGRRCKPKWGHFSSLLSKSEKSSQKMFMATPNERKIDSSCETKKSNVDSQKLNPRTRQLNTKLRHYTSVFNTTEHSNKSIAEPKSKTLKPLMCVLVKPMSHVGPLELDSEATEFKPRGTRLPLPCKPEKGNKKQKVNADKWAMYPTCNPDKLSNDAEVLELDDSKEMLPECENIPADSRESKHRDHNCEAHNSESEDLCSGCNLDKPLSCSGELQFSINFREPQPEHELIHLSSSGVNDIDHTYADAEKWAMYPTYYPDKPASYADVVKLNNEFIQTESENIPAYSRESEHWDQNCETQSAESNEMDSGCETAETTSYDRLLNERLRDPLIQSEIQSEWEQFPLGSSEVNDMDHRHSDADKRAMDPTNNPDKPASYADVLKVNNDSMEVQPECENVPVVSIESKQGHENYKTHNAKSMKMDSLCDFDIPLHYVSRLRLKTWESQHEYENIPCKNKDLDLKYVVHKEDSPDMDSECSGGEPKSNADLLKLSSTSLKLQPGCKRISKGSGGSRVLKQKFENHNVESRGMDLKPSPDTSGSSGVNSMRHTYANADKWVINSTYSPDKPASYADVLKVNNDSMEVEPEYEHVLVVSDESKQGHENCKTNNEKSMKMDSLCDFDTPLHYVSRLRLKALDLQHKCENIPPKNKDLDHKYVVHNEDCRDIDTKCSAGEPKSYADRLKRSTTSLKLQSGRKRIYHKPTSYADIVKLDIDFRDMQPECENIPVCSWETNHWDQNCETQSAESNEKNPGCETTNYVRLLTLNTRMREPQSEWEQMPPGSIEVNDADHLYADCDVHEYKMNAAASIPAKSMSCYNNLQNNPATEEYVVICTNTNQKTALRPDVYTEHSPPTFWSSKLNVDIPHDDTDISDNEIQDVGRSLSMLAVAGSPRGFDHSSDSDDDGPKTPELWRSLSPWSWSNLPPIHKPQLVVPNVLGCLRDDEGVNNTAVETQQDDAEKGAVGLLAMSNLFLEAPELEMNVDEFTKMVGDTFS